jgi:hypothetical protein
MDTSGGTGPPKPKPAPRTWMPNSLRDWLGKDYDCDVYSVAIGENSNSKSDVVGDREVWKALTGIWNLKQITSYIEPLDEDLAQVSRLRYLKHVDLQTTPKLTDDALRSLGRLSRLETLTISGGRYTTAGFRNLTGLRHLRRLGLLSWRIPPQRGPLVKWLGSERAVDVTDEDLAEIGKLIGLEELRIASTRITDAGLAHLARLSNLKKLELGATSVTSAGFEHLAKLKNLEMVTLYCPRLSDEGLRFVAQWPQLRHLTQLQLHGTRVTGASLGQLHDTPKLSALSISPAIDVDLAQLKLQLPQCRGLQIGPRNK